MLEQYLRTYSNFEQTSWLDNFPKAKFCYNLHHHRSVDMSPFKATYEFDPLVNWSTEIITESSPTLLCWLLDSKNFNLNFCRELEHAKDTAKQFANGKYHHLKFKKGETVFVDRRFIKTRRPLLS